MANDITTVIVKEPGQETKIGFIAGLPTRWNMIRDIFMVVNAASEALHKMGHLPEYTPLPALSKCGTEEKLEEAIKLYKMAQLRVSACLFRLNICDNLWESWERDGEEPCGHDLLNGFLGFAAMRRIDVSNAVTVESWWQHHVTVGDTRCRPTPHDADRWHAIAERIDARLKEMANHNG